MPLQIARGWEPFGFSRFSWFSRFLLFFLLRSPGANCYAARCRLCRTCFFFCSFRIPGSKLFLLSFCLYLSSYLGECPCRGFALIALSCKIFFYQAAHELRPRGVRASDLTLTRGCITVSTVDYPSSSVLSFLRHELSKILDFCKKKVYICIVRRRSYPGETVLPGILLLKHILKYIRK